MILLRVLKKVSYLWIRQGLGFGIAFRVAGLVLTLRLQSGSWALIIRTRTGFWGSFKGILKGFYKGSIVGFYSMGGVPYPKAPKMVLGLLGEGFGFRGQGLGPHSKGPGALGK